MQKEESSQAHILTMHEEFKAAVLEKLHDGETRMDAMQQELSTMKEGIGQILEIFEAGKGGFKFLGWLGIAAKWVTYVVGMITAVWALVQTIKGGGKP